MGAMNDVFDRIDTWLKENGMSRRKLALKAHIPPSSLQSVMARRSNLSFSMSKALAEAMGVSYEYLLFGTSDEEIKYLETIGNIEEILGYYGYAIEVDDIDCEFCYIFPAEENENQDCNIKKGARLPISFVDAEIKGAIENGEKLKKQYVGKRIETLLNLSGDANFQLLLHNGDI